MRQGDYYPRANDDKIFSSSLPHNSAPAASVGGRVHLSHPPDPKLQSISQDQSVACDPACNSDACLQQLFMCFFGGLQSAGSERRML